MSSNWEAHQQGGSGSTTGLHDSTALGQTLHFTTNIKLQELEKQRLAFEAHAKVLEQANNTTDLTQRVEMLLKAVRDWTGSGGFKDPTAKEISGASLTWNTLISGCAKERRIRASAPRTYGTTRPASNTPILLATCPPNGMRAGILSPAFLVCWLPRPSSRGSVRAGRKEMVEQMERLQYLIFEPAAIDVAAYTTYLNGLFSSDAGKEVLKSFRDQISPALVQLQHERITADDMSWTIRSVLSSDLMNQGKRATPKEMAASTIVLEELASVLTMQTASSSTCGVLSTGNNTPLMTLIFSTAFFSNTLASSGKLFSKMPLMQKPSDVVERFRVLNRQNHFFLTQLTSSTARRQYDDEGDAEESGNETLKTVQIKQRLIHLMMNDRLLNTAVHKSHTVVRSDFEWFGPSFPHNSTLATLKYFGVSQPWLKFFKSFLRAPTRFRRDPISVFRSTSAPTDWTSIVSTTMGPRPGASASVAGLKFNEKKTDAVRVGGELSAKLPRGDVRWGLLKFDVEQARFAIDQEGVALHIIEFQCQLAATKSFFGWINVTFNRYMAFFQRIFGGRPPACFGQPLINDIIDTLARIQTELFPNHGGAIGYLQSLIKTRFGVDNIPEDIWVLSGSEDQEDSLPAQLFVKHMEVRDRQRYRGLQENRDLGRTSKSFQ
ncbi:hypothetical protein BDN71DRAFT_1430082 [Pleurotus eryngii]|uniref:Uncharacterized protein n=1 Tax=Pleurotus eryngii TaxID=5323 RepID=A0A9P6D889_PLEER|nr:hypothetical protein BDN71DRAFT_1430082 [Pleurotus eryngii]